MSLNGSLEGIVNELNEILVRAEGEVEQRQAELETAKAEVSRVRSMLKAAGALQPEPKKAKATKPAHASAETRAAILAVINRWIEMDERALEQVPHSFTVKDLEGLTSAHHSSIRNAISDLRAEGLVRAVGLKPGMARRAPMAYVLGEGNEASE